MQKPRAAAAPFSKQPSTVARIPQGSLVMSAPVQAHTQGLFGNSFAVLYHILKA